MSIKIDRARRLSGAGAYPATCAAALANVPASIVAALPARMLAELIDAMSAAHQSGKALALREACDEGAVWDARDGLLREIAP